MVKCKNCAFYCHDWCDMRIDSPDPDMERECEFYHALTNGAKISFMTDEELADFLVNKVFNWLWCDNTAPVDPVTKDCLKNDGDCLKCCREWLYKEYEDDK